VSRRRAFFSLVASVIVAPLASAQTIPAFPGADGAAARASGGRGGIVYHVTKLDRNLSHNEPGTLRYGLNDANFVGQPRTIVFDVAGTFWLGRFGEERSHHNGWDTQSRLNLGSNITIAGQTAPGPIYIMGGVVKAGGNNVILRNVGIAPGYGMRTFEQPDADPPAPPASGDFPDSYVYDALDITGTNIMVDHISTFYATDETISANELADNVTIQYSNISQGQNYPQADAEGSGVSYTGHALGSLLQGGTNSKFSVHHNLYAHQKGRLPRVGSEVGTGAFNDFRNNVFYNWLGTAGSGASGQPSFNNFVANYWRAGPGGEDPHGGSSTIIVNRSGGTTIFNGSNSSGTRVYQSANVKDTNKNGAAEFTIALTNSDFGSSSFQAAALWSQGQRTYLGVTDTAATAYDRVLRYMGTRWWTRDYEYTLGNIDAIDSVDERLIHETATGTGRIMAWADDPFNFDPGEGLEWRNLLSLRAHATTGTAPFNRPVDWDGDGDGMPGYWEKAHGLDPDAADNNGDFDSDGYTNLEEYINEIAAWPAPQPLSFDGATNNRYAQNSNWDIDWQPSKYDQVQINSGMAIVDAVGQHAGTLLIAPNSGDTGQLSITSGWLKVYDAVIIGGMPTSNGELRLSGGSLSTRLLSKHDESRFQFTGGTLEVEVVGFDLVNNGGTLVLRPSLGTTTIHDDFQIVSGALDTELVSSGSFGRIVATGSITLGGELHVRLSDGFVPQFSDQFVIVTGTTVGGEFSNLNSSERVFVEDGSGSFLVTITSNQVMLTQFVEILAGDFNDDGIVDAADYVVWRKNVDTMNSLPNDSIGGLIGAAHYELWRANYRSSWADRTNGLDGIQIPEPSSCILVISLSLVATYLLASRAPLTPWRVRHSEESTDFDPRRNSQKLVSLTARCRVAENLSVGFA
jgi:hypothetical protein